MPLSRRTGPDADEARFIGIDLAWGTRSPTGVAAIRGGELVTARLLTDDAILAFVEDHLTPEGPAVVAVDAPLRVPNERGRRTCEAELARDWAGYDAGAHPANRQRLANNGVVRGEALVAALAQRLGFGETAPIPQYGPGRYVCEVYPHPAHVALFRLDRTLKYKRGVLAARRAGLAQYLQLLAGLKDADPPLPGVEPFAAVKLDQLHSGALKELEDRLDAVTCAYIALYAWTHGPGQQRVYGSVAAGHILTLAAPDNLPLPARRKARPRSNVN